MRKDRQIVEIVLTFSNTNYSIKGEQALLAADIPVKVMPLPAEIRAGCGLCLRIDEIDFPKVKLTLKEANVPVEGEYLRKTVENKTVYEAYEKGIENENF